MSPDQPVHEVPDRTRGANELFRTDEVAVRRWDGFSRRCCFVTFDSYSDYRGLDRPGFGEAFLGEHGIDAIHVVTRQNDWYQYPDMPEVCARIREVIEGYDRVIAYGSSMGGYAAIRFGRLVGASVALALSPQFSIDRRRAPFEKRWGDANRISFVHEADPPPFVQTAIIAYDKHDTDAKHVALFREATKVIDVALLDCGHPCTGFLAELGLLQRSVLELADGRFDAAALEAEGRRRRRESGQYYLTLCRRSRGPARRLALAQLALERGSANITYLANLAVMAAAQNRADLALDALSRCEAIAPEHPVVRFHRSEALDLLGDLPGAISALEDVPDDFVRTEVHEMRLAHLRTKSAKQARRARMVEMVERSGQRPEWPIYPPVATGPISYAGLVARRAALRARKWLGLPPAKRPPASRLVREDAELRVTTYPSPPPFHTSWYRHDQLIRRLPHRPVDLLMIGDSLVENWPDAEWPDWRVFNFGVAADKIQHVLWRLDQVTRPIVARHVLLLVGTNNLAAGDTAYGMVAGMEELVRRLAAVAPGARVLAIEIPPCGPALDFNNAERALSNRLLRQAGFVKTLSVDAELTACGSGPDNPYYQPDHIHFSPDGYRLLTSLVRRVWP